MKKIYIVLIVLAALALLLVAANEWPARLVVRNQTDADVILSLDYPYSWLVVAPGTTTEFHIEKGVYNALVTACGETASGVMDLEHNLKLNFTACDLWANDDTPKYLGEPTMEKPNWFKSPGTAEWRFQY
ncbi:MAG: hypothetical protein KAS36_08140 [Anaerolineales bacterium]|jgi:hypothetical protein|nr:hypothetical protein [Anaerolineales bacterium]MCK5315161.1 hypothetical protein [Anaerolineales bacterium]